MWHLKSKGALISFVCLFVAGAGGPRGADALFASRDPCEWRRLRGVFHGQTLRRAPGRHGGHQRDRAQRLARAGIYALLPPAIGSRSLGECSPPSRDWLSL
eukprot:475464-Prorocentrum_minimum.AAC.1